MWIQDRNRGGGTMTNTGKEELVVIAEGRLDMRGGELYLDHEPLTNVLAIYADGEITICISKEREARRRAILDEIFVEENHDPAPQG